MNKSKVFFGAVQVVVAGLSMGVRGKVDVLVRAGEIPEDAIPNDVAAAAMGFVEYAADRVVGETVFKRRIEPPDWYRDWLDSLPEVARPVW